MANKVTVIVEVDPTKETKIQPFGAKLAENVAASTETTLTGSATGTGTNPPDADGDGDVD